MNGKASKKGAMMDSGNETRPQQAWEPPVIEVLGRLDQLTGLNFPTSNGDFNFNGVSLGATS